MKEKLIGRAAGKKPRIVLESEKAEYFPTKSRKSGYVNRATERREMQKIGRKKTSGTGLFVIGRILDVPSYAPRRKKVKGWMRDNKVRYVKPNDR